MTDPGDSLYAAATAMIITQTVLVLPITAAVTRQTISDLDIEYPDYLRSLRVHGDGR